MSLVVPPHPQEEAWKRGEAETIATMGVLNAATAELVGTIGMLIDTGGWGGHGIMSIEHWVCWKADVSRRRAEGLVRIARRRGELPVCLGLFAEGRLTEDAMTRIARRVPAERDAEVAGWATGMTISQLTRVLATLPELPDPDARAPMDPQRHFRFGDRPDGWLHGTFCVPPDEAAEVKLGLDTARDAEFRDRNGLDDDTHIDRPTGISWADAFVRMAAAATDHLDTTLTRTGRVGTRHQIVLHHDIDPHGTLGPGTLHDGLRLPDSVARYLGCDAETIANLYIEGRLIGITPAVREPSRALRRALERRDGGCAHPLCTQRRWLHIHHLRHWADGGTTTPDNLLCLCPTHHRALHNGDFTITGNPEHRTLTFIDRRGSPITPPGTGPPGPTQQGTYTPPLGERLDPRWFGWN